MDTTVSVEVSLSRRDGHAVRQRVDLPPEFLRVYELGRTLGSGGMGTVLLARHRATDRLVAVKLLLREDDPELLERFVREGRALGQVRHPNVLAILEAGSVRGHPYLVTEYLEGGSLREMMARPGALTVSRVVQVLTDCLAGLDACHRARIVHRDIKPENILFAADGTAKIADFGIAKKADASLLTQAGSLIGTPLYMAPERLRSQPAGPASDIYAVGMIGYELLAGWHPFADVQIVELIALHLTTAPTPLARAAPHVPAPIARVIEQAIAKSPRERPRGAAEMAMLLREASARRATPSNPAPPAPSAPIPTPTGQPRLAPRRLAAVPLLLVAVLAGYAWDTALTHSTRAPAPAAASVPEPAPSRVPAPAARPPSPQPPPAPPVNRAFDFQYVHPYASGRVYRFTLTLHDPDATYVATMSPGRESGTVPRAAYDALIARLGMSGFPALRSPSSPREWEEIAFPHVGVHFQVAGQRHSVIFDRNAPGPAKAVMDALEESFVDEVQIRLITR